MATAQQQTIYQTKKGITLTDGLFLVRNPRTQRINVISISKGIVYIHDVTRQMNLQQLIWMDSVGQLEIFETLKLNELEKEKTKKKKNK